jgi:glucose dehydrogenase
MDSFDILALIGAILIAVGMDQIHQGESFGYIVAPLGLCIVILAGWLFTKQHRSNKK